MVRERERRERGSEIETNKATETTEIDREGEVEWNESIKKHPTRNFPTLGEDGEERLLM